MAASEPLDLQVLAGNSVVSIRVDAATTVATLKSLLVAETRVSEAKQNIYFKGKLLENKQSLAEAGVKTQEMLEMRSGVPSSPVVAPINTSGGAAAASGAAAVGAAARAARAHRPTLDNIPPQLFQNPAGLQNYIRSEPALLDELMRVNPTMAEAVLSPTPDFLASFLAEQAMNRKRAEDEQFRRINALNSNPLDLEAQSKIAEDIRLKNVDANMEMAMEYNPEAFGRVVMLYVPMIVNKVPVTAFVDSGAQSTIMSVECAKRCNFDRLIDRRYAGTAVGVGTAKIVGRVHAAVLQVGTASLTASFTILDNQGMDFLFGLDMLKKFQACIDLKDNALKIAGQSIPFLAEKDIPKKLMEEETVHSPTAHPKPAASAHKPAASSASSSSSSAAAAAPLSASAAAAIARNNAAAAATAKPPAAATSSSGAAAAATATGGGAAKPIASTAPKPAASGAAAAAASTTNSNAAAAGRGSGGGNSSASTPAAGRGGGGGGGGGGSAQSRQPPTQFPESAITAVMNVGASRAQAQSALTMFGGNAEAAAAYIFQSMGGGF